MFPLACFYPSLYSYTLNCIAVTTTIQPTLHIIKFSLGNIYTNMTFRLFTNIAPMGSQEHIYIYVPSIHGEVLTRPATSRRDLFPNKLPLHSGMGCRTSPIRFRHAFSLSGISTLVIISDPFSAVWIFVSANSRSSTCSRIQ